MARIPQNLPTIDSVIHKKIPGPWWTRKGDGLYLVFTTELDNALRGWFFGQEEEELKFAGRDIRGVRLFFLADLKPGSSGGDQFHRLRTEISFTIDGEFQFECEDIHGAKRDYIVDKERMIIMPPYVRHAFRTVKQGTLLTLANTIFEMEDAQTYDTYSVDEFKRLQAEYKVLQPET